MFAVVFDMCYCFVLWFDYFVDLVVGYGILLVVGVDFVVLLTLTFLWFVGYFGLFCLFIVFLLISLFV